MILYGENNTQLIKSCFNAGANLGIFLELSMKRDINKNANFFLENFLKGIERPEINSEKFLGNLKRII